MALSVLDLFSVGIGPSSSHTVGPMRAARRFVTGLSRDGLLEQTARVRAELFGSLGATGHGHHSDRAVLLGLQGEDPETVDTSEVEARATQVREEGRILLGGTCSVPWTPDDLVLHRRRSLPGHPNGMTFEVLDGTAAQLRLRTYFSVGGGFVVEEEVVGVDRVVVDDAHLPYCFSGDELLAMCRSSGLSVPELMTV